MKDVAKKTIEKIEKEQAKLDSLLAKREELTVSYQSKLNELNDGIKEQEKIIASLRDREKNEKLNAVASMFNKSGVSVDDLLNAVANNDLYALQEMLENKGTSKTSSAPVESNDENADGEDGDAEASDEFENVDTSSNNNDNYGGY